MAERPRASPFNRPVGAFRFSNARQGAAQALEDAVVLGRQAAQGGAIEDVLRRYEHVRIPRTRKIVTLARRNAAMGSMTNPLACSLRDMAIRFVPERVILKSLVEMGRA